MKKKAKLINITPPKLCPYWVYRCADGEVAVYIPNGDKMTLERANFLLDSAKRDLLK